MSEKLFLPELGEGIDSVDISEVLIKPGDTISADDPVLVLESEKATMEIPAEKDGVVVEVFVSVGDKLSPGGAIYSIDAAAETKPLQKEIEKQEEEPAPKSEDRSKEPPKTNKPAEKEVVQTPPAPTPPTISDQNKTVSASPSVRRFARELGVDLSLVTGTGLKNRISKEDVQGFVKAQLSSGPIARTQVNLSAGIDFATWGEVEQVPLSKIKKITGERLQQAWNTIPHVTQFDEADVTELYKMRKVLQATNKGKSKLSFLPFFIKAAIKALKEFPAFNSSLDASGSNLVFKKYFHIGIAVDTSNGLVVPVLRDADKKSIWELSDELADISSRARDKKIMPAELKGGSFTISSLGGISGTGFTPIINPPEVAILGVSKITNRPALLNGDLVERKYLPLSLSYDHRVIDGAEAARFTKVLTTALSDISELEGLGSGDSKE